VHELKNTFLNEFRETGFAIAHADALDKLELIRRTLFEEAGNLCDAGDDAAAFMNEFHKREMSGAELNDFRMAMIRGFNERLDAGEVIFDAFQDSLLRLVGPDVAVQKSCNIVIQQPGDIDVSPIHRDAPPNSPFEVVLWIPLVDCYGTKGLSLLDRKGTNEVIADLRVAGKDGADKVYEKARRIGHRIEASFGTACFFWTGLMHVIPVNEEVETRWSLNIRYKNLFSPQGAKRLPDFFRILRLSPLADLAIKSERETAMDDR